jgi:hypothetical protein
MCTSVDPLLGLGSSLVLQGNSNVTLLNHRITLGTKGWLTFLTAAAINMFAEFNVHVLSVHFLSCATSRRHLPVVAENDILLSEEFVKGGCPSHLRKGLWKQVLLSHVGEKV